MKRLFPGLVVACTVVAGLLISSPAAADSTPTSPGDETAAIEPLYRLELLPRLRSADSCKMFSSYDRTGGNDDGFKGTYSKLRVEDGNAVVAEMTGAGCIQRIHLPHSIYSKPGLLGRKGEHIRIYLDGNEKPALDVPLEDIFRGKVDGFPKPLVGEGSGGHYCYVPIAYRDGCKVVFEGTAVKFYAVEYTTYPNAEGVVTFQNPPTDAQRKALAAAAKVWNSCGDLGALDVGDAEETKQAIAVKSGKTLDMALPSGPRMVRAVYLQGKPDSLKNAGDVRLEIRWDGAENPAVDVPLDFFFCQAMAPKDFRSLLVGVNEQGWYNFMPMPYQKSARITLVADKPLDAVLTVVTTELPKRPGELGYLHAAYHESLPTQKGKFHPWLNRQGRGHYVGTYLATAARREMAMPSWLEGDEFFTCDGELRIHGTGSEDYFNCGWYGTPGRLLGPCAFPMHGFSVYRKDGEKPLAAAFRWNVPDPIPYEKSIEAKIEHGPGNNIPTDYRSAAFFYDAAP
ncbi:MAG: DUF2961 domain-containing protein [Pirellulales bacterium]|nr:DUF2961 domain-containing protein [Pirellulales bacterium]